MREILLDISVIFTCISWIFVCYGSYNHNTTIVTSALIFVAMNSAAYFLLKGDD